MKLYHGTDYKSAVNIWLNGVDLSKGNDNLDFGKGFYTTTDRDKAINRALFKAGYKKNNAYVVTIDIDKEKWMQLNVKIFEQADKEWGKFIINNRAGLKIIGDTGTILHNLDNKYDIVVGEIADGTVSMLAHMVKTGKMNIEDIDYTSFLTDFGKSYGMQISFHTKEALACITSLECGKITYKRKERM